MKQTHWIARFGVAAFFAAVLAVLPVTAWSSEAVAVIKSVSGEATVLRGAETLRPEVGLELAVGDAVRTASGGSVGLSFNDGTRVSLGPSSEFSVTAFVFAPEDKKFAFNAHMRKGTMVYASGKLGKVAPEAVSIRTPHSTVGIRGTKLLIKVD